MAGPSASSAGASAVFTPANSPNGRRNWCAASSRLARRSPAIRGRQTPGASTSSPAAVAAFSRFSRADEGGAPGADYLDLEPDRWRCVMALQRGNPGRPRGKYRGESSHLGLGRILRRFTPSPTGSPSPKAIGRLFTGRAGGASSIPIPGNGGKTKAHAHAAPQLRSRSKTD